MISVKRIVATFLVAGLGCSMAASAWAAEQAAKPRVVRGIYGGGGVGIAMPDGAGDEYAWRMDVWLRLMRYGSLQLGYANLGDGAGGSGNGDSDGVTFSGVPQLPIGDMLTLHAKVGVMSATIDNDTQTELTFGAGASVELPKNFGVRAEWEYYDFEETVNALWLSLYYQFASF
jgi:opacity protein-like surface antigen